MGKLNWKQVGGGLAAGALAGMAGSLALSLTDALERRFLAGSASSAAQETDEALGDSPDGKLSLTDHAVQLGYGTAAGAIRGAILAFGFTGIPGKLLYWGTTALSSKTILPALGLAPRLEEKQSRGLGANLAHHVIYAVVSLLVLGAFKRFTPFDPEVNA